MPTYESFLATHSHRMECFFRKFIPIEKKFGNCCVLKLVITSDNLDLDVLFNGFDKKGNLVDPRNTKFLTTNDKSRKFESSEGSPPPADMEDFMDRQISRVDPSPPNSLLGSSPPPADMEDYMDRQISFEGPRNSITKSEDWEIEDAKVLDNLFETSKLDPMGNIFNRPSNGLEIQQIPGVNYSSIDKDDTFIFYIIRHGEAQHNPKDAQGVIGKLKRTTQTKYRDSALTPTGIKQAIQAGVFLTGPTMPEINLNNANLFCSDLKRTRQTLLGVLYGIGVDIDRKPFVVIPCSHELMKTGKYDESCDKFQAPHGTKENKMKCDCIIDEDGNCCDFIEIDIPGSGGPGEKKIQNRVDWSFYKKFYGQNTRNTRKLSQITDQQWKIDDTGFQQQAIDEETAQRCQNTNMIRQCICYIKHKGQICLDKPSIDILVGRYNKIFGREVKKTSSKDKEYTLLSAKSPTRTGSKKKGRKKTGRKKKDRKKKDRKKTKGKKTKGKKTKGKKTKGKKTGGKKTKGKKTGRKKRN